MNLKPFNNKNKERYLFQKLSQAAKTSTIDKKAARIVKELLVENKDNIM
jgi:hypothetical protein